MIPTKQARRPKKKCIPLSCESRMKKKCENYGKYSHSQLSCQFSTTVSTAVSSGSQIEEQATNPTIPRRRVMHCSKCGGAGHTNRTCKRHLTNNATTQDQPNVKLLAGENVEGSTPMV